ncbi:hypothetical protein [Bacillus wiedmannii]|uniref:hypothetical protein n=1 Tax=Bacillus wiedmannii TaxID=1890302 RepID=UPI0015D4AC28|nr:hypothetical protein [Bacillus wiedmannii]
MSTLPAKTTIIKHPVSAKGRLEADINTVIAHKELLAIDTQIYIDPNDGPMMVVTIIVK